MKKTALLKEMINSNDLEFIMEAHNGLSARIVENAGFKGIWGSGLSISASLGVRDNNEASWTQVLDVLEFMSDATSIPILLDGDTGYGNFNNVRRLVQKLEQRGIAGVCIEDKLFPKTNSFIGGEAQPLADIDEFCGKIKAAKDTQNDPDFCVVARVESLIAGWGMKEALRRAEAYRVAGADAVLIHSKKSNYTEIDLFMREWANRHPVIIVPTKYYSTPTEYIRESGVSMVIWANHNVRASIAAMQNTTRTIYEDQSLINVEGKVSSVAEIFHLQNAEELEEAEKLYLPTSGKQVNTIILAASQGDLGDLTMETPKTLLNIGGKSLLETQIDEFNRVGIKNISVVRGFGKEKFTISNVTYIDNEQYSTTGELYSLHLAKGKINDNTVFSYGDIIYKNYILNDLLNDVNDITIIADADYEYVPDGRKDYISTDRPYSKVSFMKPSALTGMADFLIPEEITGEFIGLWKVSGNGKGVVLEALELLEKREDFESLTTGDLFQQIIDQGHTIAVKFIKGSWLDIDSLVDLQKAGTYLD